MKPMPKWKLKLNADEIDHLENNSITKLKQFIAWRESERGGIDFDCDICDEIAEKLDIE
jgi:hypothetical protein